MTSLSNMLYEFMALSKGPLRVQDPEDQALFLRQCEAQFPHHSQIVAAVIGVCTLLWWPSDVWVYRQMPGVGWLVARWRIAITLLSVAYLLLRKTRPVHRHPYLSFTLGISLGCAVTGYYSGCMGGPKAPWIHLSTVLPFSTVTLPLPLARRLLLTILVAIATLGGFFLPFPGYLVDPISPMAMSFMVCTVLLSLVFGHGIHMLSHANFSKERQLGRDAVAIAGHASQLEQRVAEQTRELRRLLNHVEAAREVERTRIARDLHDELGQALSALRFRLAFTKRRYRSEPQQIGLNLDELDEILGNTVVTARRIVSGLRPPILDAMGLFAAAEWLLRSTETRGHPGLELKTKGSDAELSREMTIGAFRIIQESLTNAVRHAAAQHIAVSIVITTERMTLRITDDGMGIGKPPSPNGSGFGLLGMRERAQALGGSFSIEGRPGAGTTISAVLPFPAAAGKRSDP